MTDAPFFGLSAFPVTPLAEDGSIEVDRLQSAVAGCVAAGVDTVGVLGSTGLYPYLDLPDRAQGYRAAVEAAEGRPVLAGIGALNLQTVVQSAKAAEGAGCAGLLLAPVQYLPLTDDEVAGLFSDVAGATGLPVLVYNNPGTTGRDIPEALLARLAAIDGVGGVKNPSSLTGGPAAQLGRLRAALPQGFSVGYSGDATIAAAARAGADAWYSVLAGTFPEISLALWRARGDAAALAEMDARLAPLWALFAAHGGIRLCYGAMEIMGRGPCPLPAPLAPLPASVRSDLARALDAAGLGAEAAA